MSSPRIRDTLVICYHAVSPTWPSVLAIPPSELEEQVSVLQRRGYTAKTFADAVIDGDGMRSFSVTFDDAYQSVWIHAKPVLDELGVPATVFVSTSHVDVGGPLGWRGNGAWLDSPHARELDPLTWEQMRELTEQGWEVASHAHSHVPLTSLDDQALKTEIETSRDLLVANVAEPRSFAYPYGDHNRKVRQAVDAAGFEAAAAAPLPGEPYVADPLQWPRVGVYRGSSSRFFRLRTMGAVRRARGSAVWKRLHGLGGSKKPQAVDGQAA